MRRHQRYERFAPTDVLLILETAARCPHGVLKLYLDKRGVSEAVLHKWREKWGPHGGLLRAKLEKRVVNEY